MMTIGNRIRQARVAAGLSMHELAKKAAPLSATAISNYELGKDTPRPTTLLRLAEALGVQTEYFLRKTQVQLECVEYRRRSTFSAAHQRVVEERIRQELEPYVEVESVFPPGWLEGPSLTRDGCYQVTSPERAEDAAEYLRAQWNLGTDPIENLPDALEDHGIKVLLINAPDGFDGLSCWVNGAAPAIAVNKAKPWDRLRSDLAHELGELFLLVVGSDPKEKEKVVQRFAGAFLAPRQAVRRELGKARSSLSIQELRQLKEEYGLSMQAWVFRAYHAGVITEPMLQALFRRFAALGLRKDEGTPDRKVDEPWRFRALVYQAEAEGFITPAKRAELLGEVSASGLPMPDPKAIAAAAERLKDYYTESTAEQDW